MKLIVREIDRMEEIIKKVLDERRVYDRGEEKL